MTLTLKTSLAALLFTLTLAPALHASGPRLLAYYQYSDRYSIPAYDAFTIPYDQLTHIVHSNIAPSSKGDGISIHPQRFCAAAADLPRPRRRRKSGTLRQRARRPVRED